MFTSLLYRENVFTLIQLEPKEINLYHQSRASPACTSGQSDQALYCWLTNFKFQSRCLEFNFYMMGITINLFIITLYIMSVNGIAFKLSEKRKSFCQEQMRGTCNSCPFSSSHLPASFFRKEKLNPN